ncbi:MAG: hypothetical protein ABMA15_18605 [Vicinamibacterales bacterium]
MDLHEVAEARSLAIHAEIARRLEHDASVVSRARDTLERWRRDGRIAPAYARQWDYWLTRTVQELAALLTDEGEAARALRQNSPFVGIIDPRTRWAIWRDVRQQADR